MEMSVHCVCMWYVSILNLTETLLSVLDLTKIWLLLSLNKEFNQYKLDDFAKTILDNIG